MSNFRTSSVPRSRRGHIYDDGHDFGNTSASYAYHQNHTISASTPSSLPMRPQSPILSEFGPLRKTCSTEKKRDSLGIFSTRGAPPKNIFANQGGIGNDYRSTPTDLFSSNLDSMFQETRNPDDYNCQSSSRMKTYTRENRQEDDYISRVSAEMREGHRRTQEELMKQLSVKESEINELRQNEIAKKNAHLFKTELEKREEEMQAEQDKEIEAVQQELADTMDEIKYLKKGCEVVEQEAEASSKELKEVCQRNEDILAEIAQLRSKNEELCTENELLTERYDNVLHEKIECERVSKELTEQLEDKKLLECTIEEMEMEFQHLADQQEATKNHLEEAWAENNELKMRCIQLQKEMEELREDNRLESQLNNKVKEQRDKIGDTVKEKQSEIEMLKERNEDLQREMDELKNELLHTLDVASIYQKTHEIIKNDS
eukprot:scaffold3066_cov131-Skeletonema_menzelii.AAC.9